MWGSHNKSRSVTSISSGMMTSDGAGVKLRRIIGSMEVNMVDPFLLLDEFRSDNPDDYIEGFPPPSPPRHRDGDIHAGGTD